MESSTPGTATRTLIVSRPKEGRLGSLVFDAANRVSLTTEGSGPAVDALKAAWADMSKRDKLSWVRSIVEERNGRKVTALESEDFGRDHPNYIYAVLDTLSREYGYAVDIKK